MPKQIRDEHILAAAVEVIVEQGWRAATTKQIAARAGINEVTLFRRFGSKSDLLREALAREAESFMQAGVTPTGDVRADLERVVELYAERVARIGQLVPVVFGELARDPAAKALLAEPRRMASAVAELIAHYQASGALDDGEPPLVATLALLGPIMALGLVGRAVDPPPELPPAADIVRRYLDGHARSQPPPRRKRVRS